MSFILDALRKSDQQRQRSVTPTLMTVQTPAAESSQPAWWWYGVLAAVLVGAGILIGWLHRSQPEPVAPVILPTISRVPDLSAQAISPTPAVAFPTPPRKPEAQAPLRESGTISVTAAPVPAVAAMQLETPAKPLIPSPVAVAPIPSAPAKQEEHGTASGSAKDSSVVTLAELPPQIQQELPKLAILAHSYSSKPKSRFVFINDQMVHEEESPAPGLKLEQITPEGMIFSYKGYRFRRSANP